MSEQPDALAAIVARHAEQLHELTDRIELLEERNAQLMQAATRRSLLPGAGSGDKVSVTLKPGVKVEAR